PRATPVLEGTMAAAGWNEATRARLACVVRAAEEGRRAAMADLQRAVMQAQKDAFAAIRVAVSSALSPVRELHVLAREVFDDPYVRALDSLTSARISAAERWKIAGELARAPRLIPRRWKSPAVQRRLREEADAHGGHVAVRRWLVEDVCPHAIIEAAATLARPQRVRFGHKG